MGYLFHTTQVDNFHIFLESLPKCYVVECNTSLHENNKGVYKYTITRQSSTIQIEASSMDEVKEDDVKIILNLTGFSPFRWRSRIKLYHDIVDEIKKID